MYVQGKFLKIPALGKIFADFNMLTAFFWNLIKKFYLGL